MEEGTSSWPSTSTAKPVSTKQNKMWGCGEEEGGIEKGGDKRKERKILPDVGKEM